MSSLSRSVLLTATPEFDGPQVEMLESNGAGKSNGTKSAGTSAGPSAKPVGVVMVTPSSDNNVPPSAL